MRKLIFGYFGNKFAFNPYLQNILMLVDSPVRSVIFFCHFSALTHIFWQV